MPLTTDKINLEERLAQKHDERDEVAAEVAELEPENPVFENKSRKGNTLDTHIKGIEQMIARECDDDLETAADDYDLDDVDELLETASLLNVVREYDIETPTITLTGLTGGEYAAAKNDAQEMGNKPGSMQVATIANGTEDAPYLVCGSDGSLDEAKTYYEIGNLSYDLQRWLEDEINAMTSPGNLSTTFGQLVAEKRHETDGATN